MIRTILVITALLFPLTAAAESPVESFSKAKKYLADLHEDIGHQTTLYCGCPYERTTRSGGDLDRDACGLEARKNEKRSDRVEWEHVVPASWFGQTRACWILKEAAYPQCEGKSGRKCCELVNEDFDLAHNDPNNLFPSGGEVNGDRSNYAYVSEIPGEDRVYGQCDFEMGRIDGEKVAEPSPRSLGTVARAMLYMSEVYGVNVKLDFETIWKWHSENPAEPWEIERAERIANETGLRNSWVLGEQNP